MLMTNVAKFRNASYELIPFCVTSRSAGKRKICWSISIIIRPDDIKTDDLGKLTIFHPRGIAYVEKLT